MPTLMNINPLGEVDVPLLGRTLEAGEEFEVSEEIAAVLLEQVGNYELVATKKATATRTASPASDSAAAQSDTTNPAAEPAPTEG